MCVFVCVWVCEGVGACVCVCLCVGVGVVYIYVSLKDRFSHLREAGITIIW